MKAAALALLFGSAAASPPGYGSSTIASIVSSLEKLLPANGWKSGDYAPVTSQIVKDYLEPVKVSEQLWCWKIQISLLTARLGTAPSQQLRRP